MAIPSDSPSPSPGLLALPNARPYPFQFPLATTALIIIDIQRDFVDPGGFGAIQCGNDAVFSKARAIVPRVREVLDVFRALGGHVLHTREGHQPDLADLPAAKKLRQISNPAGHHFMGIGDPGPMGRLLVRGEYGHDIVDELRPWPTEEVIDKPGKGSFWGTDLHRVLLARGITHLIFAGVTTECCVTTTLRECNDRGYQCCVLEDCTQGFDAQQVTTSLDMICAQDGLFGFVGHSSDLLAATKPTIVAADVSDSPVEQVVTLDPAKPLPSVHELQALYKKGGLSPVDVVNEVFNRIEAYQQTDPAVWTTLASRSDAVAAAQSLIDKYTTGDKALPPLYGVPFSVKDNIDVKGVKTTVACDTYAYTPSNHAIAVQHVLDAGGIYIGKTNLDQLATGLSGCRSPYGYPRSAFSRNHIAGGSSSGAAAAVGAQLVSFSLATDTAGSTRVPASLNGVVGLKPTKGTVSSRGLVPACRTLDTIGIIASNVADARTVWRIIAKNDPMDPFAKVPNALPTWKVDYRGFRAGGFDFATPPPEILGVCSPAYQSLFNASVQRLEALGGRRRQAEKGLDYSVFEKAGNLLYGGALLHERIACIGEEFIRGAVNAGDAGAGACAKVNGHKPNGGSPALSSSMATTQALHPAVRDLFAQALASGPSAYEILRDQATQAELTRLAQQAFDTLRGGVDVLVVPSTVRHPTVAEVEAEPLALNSMLGRFTHFGNVVDLCGVSVPAGTYLERTGESDGVGAGVTLPFGVTFLGGSGFDAKMLDIAGLFAETVLEEERAGGRG